MPPPKATCRTLVHDVLWLDAEVRREPASVLTTAMRTHGVGAHVTEDAD